MFTLATGVMAPPISTTVVQRLLETILAQVPAASPISGTNTEIEQKYLFGYENCEASFDRLETQIIRFFTGKKIDIRPFDGVDYSFACDGKDGAYCVFRYRTGFPVSNRLGVKVKHGKGMKRQEVEFQLAPDTDTEKVLVFLRIAAGLCGKFTETHMRVRGNIRYRHLGFTHRMMEVVNYIGTNLITLKTVSVTEIESHGHANDHTAKDAIRRYERALDWRSFRTQKSMSQLLG